MEIMILCKRSSTSSRVHEMRMLFWAISRPDVATPPAFAALAGPYSTFASTNIFVASSVLGMFAPSLTTFTPFLMRLAASFALISFCVALGNAQSALMFQSQLWSSFLSVGLYTAFLNFSVYSLMRPRRLFFRSEEHTSELQSLRHLVCRLLL